jgi:alcohol dehydrogenase class IV
MQPPPGVTTALPAFSGLLPTHFVFGPGAVHRVKGFVPGGARVLLVMSEAAGVDASIVGDQPADVTELRWRGEPDVERVEAAVAALAAARPDVVVGVGGGSVLDMAKALAGLIPNRHHRVTDYLEIVGSGRPLERDPLPVVAVPTTAGTGSEMTKNAVIGVPRAGRKVSLRDDRLVPRAAVVDPELGAGVPMAAAKACALDAIVQLVEAYATPQATPLSDLYARAGAEIGLPAAADLVAGAVTAATRSALALAASWSGAALANAKLGTIHGMAGVVGGVTGMAHGALCGLFAAPVLMETVAELRANAPQSPALDRYAALARLADPAAQRAEDLAVWIGGLVDEAALDASPIAAISPGEWPAMLEAVAAASSTAGNPARLGVEALHRVLEGVTGT